MIQLAVLVYGIVALVRGKFSVGRGKEIVGGRARILGAICASSLPIALTIGLAIGELAHKGVIEWPSDGALILFDVGWLLTVIVIVVALSKLFYRQQQRELELAGEFPFPATNPNATPTHYAVIDPDNPFASPGAKD